MAKIQPGPRKGRGKVPRDAADTWEGRVRIWVDVGGRNALGPGKMRLLDAIYASRSLSAAAKQLKMSYRQAWKHLKLIEERTGVAVVEPKRGGAGGGGMELTKEGKALLEAYRSFREDVEAHADIVCRKHFARWSPEKTDGGET
ncbi:MAG: LysR family transcriptional regulator [Phycisphaerae bacterium]